MAEQYGVLAKTLNGNYNARLDRLSSGADEAVASFKDVCENKRRAAYETGVKHLGKAAAVAPVLLALTDMGGALYRIMYGKQKTVAVANEIGCKDAATCMQVAAAARFEAIVKMEELYQKFVAEGLLNVQEFADISCHGIHTLDGEYIKPLSEKKAKLENEMGNIAKQSSLLIREKQNLMNFAGKVKERIGTTIAALEADGGPLPFEYTGNDFDSRVLSKAEKELKDIETMLVPLETRKSELSKQYGENCQKLNLLNEERAGLASFRKSLIKIREDKHLNLVGSKVIADSGSQDRLDADEAWVDAEIEKLFGSRPE